MKYLEIDINGDIVDPYEIEKNQLNPEGLYNYNCLLRDLSKLDMSHRALVVNIRSLGGSSSEAFLIYEHLKRLPIPVITRCFGICCSAATVISQAGTKREMSKYGMYCIHCSSRDSNGTKEGLEFSKNILSTVDEIQLDIYEERANVSREDLKLLSEEYGGEGRYLRLNEVIECGLIDGDIGETFTL